MTSDKYDTHLHMQRTLWWKSWPHVMPWCTVAQHEAFAVLNGFGSPVLFLLILIGVSLLRESKNPIQHVDSLNHTWPGFGYDSKTYPPKMEDWNPILHLLNMVPNLFRFHTTSFERFPSSSLAVEAQQLNGAEVFLGHRIMQTLRPFTRCQEISDGFLVELRAPTK